MNKRGRIIVRQFSILTSLSAVLIAGSLGSPAVAETKAVAAPPSSTALTAATNAMLAPTDVVAPLRTTREWSNGFINPPGGQDPLPVCVSGSGFREVSIPDTDAIGYSSSLRPLYQNVYQYPSQLAADRAWSTLNQQITQRCKGTYQINGGNARIAVTSTRIPAAGNIPQGWGVNTVGTNGKYSTVHQVGDSIVMLSFLPERPSTVAQRSTLNRLAVTVAERWATRDSLSITQPAAMTHAQQVMLQPIDVPAALPVTTPTNGGWGNSGASMFPSEPSTCASRVNIPKASQLYSAGLGGQGDVLSIPGAISQLIYDYGTPDAAQAAWQRYARATNSCKNAGTSAFVFNGTPAVWQRSMDNDNFTNKTYTVSVLAGNAIQAVTYYASMETVGPLTIDQAAVNVLAEKLAQRYLAAPRN